MNMKCEKHNQFYEDIGGTCPGCVSDLKRAELIRKTFAGKTLKYYGTTEGRSASVDAQLENLSKLTFMPFPNLFSDDLTLKFFSRESQEKRREFDPMYYALGISTKGSVIDQIVNSTIRPYEHFDKYSTEVTYLISSDTSRGAEELLDDLAEAACQLGSLKYKTCLVCMKTDVARRCNCIGEQP
jgi:hypothetical protein